MTRNWYEEDNPLDPDEEKRLNKLIGDRCTEIVKCLKHIEYDPETKYRGMGFEQLETRWEENGYSKLPRPKFDQKVMIYYYYLYMDQSFLSLQRGEEDFIFYDYMRPKEEYFLRKTFTTERLVSSKDRYGIKLYGFESETYDLDWLNDPKEIEKLENMR